MKKLIVYVHGKGGNAEEADRYKRLFADSEVIGFDYKAQTPLEAKEEFSEYFDSVRQNYDSVTTIANSIGAYFSMNALSQKNIDKACFISPVADMEKLILDMMAWANVTERELSERKEIPTDFGETLSWEYLCYVRRNPVDWHVPTHILYGENDNLTSLETISRFAAKINATLTIMSGGEHWFHTEKQMRFLDEWLKSHM